MDHMYDLSSAKESVILLGLLLLWVDLSEVRILDDLLQRSSDHRFKRLVVREWLPKKSTATCQDLQTK